MAETVAVYIDYDNLSISLKEYYGKTSEELLTKIRELINNNENLRVMKAFCDFKHIEDKEILNLDSSLVELRHVSSSNSNGKTNASDIALAIDVTKSLFNKVPIDEYYIVSSDSDMFPILKELIFFNKKVHLLYLEANIAQSYMKAIEDVGINCTSIESMLNLPIYVSINEEIKNTNCILLKKALLMINDKINEVGSRYERDGQKGTSSKKDILDKLETEYPPADSKIILTYITDNNYISTMKNGTYSSFRISSEKGKTLLDSENVEILDEANFGL